MHGIGAWVVHGVGAWVVGAWGFGFGVSINDVSYYLDVGLLDTLVWGNTFSFFTQVLCTSLNSDSYGTKD